MKIQSVNPYTEEVMQEFDLMKADQVEAEIGRSRRVFSEWRGLPVRERARYVKRLGDQLKAEKRRYAEIMTREMGKAIRESVAEVEKCAWLCDYYAENGERFLEPEEIGTEAKRSYVMFQPLGIVLAVMPWNFPFWQAFRFGIPAVTAGNVVVLKHASNVPMCALAIEEAFTKAGFPGNVFKTLLISAKDALKLIDEDKVDAVSLTGSNQAGEEVGAHAGRKIKNLVLELGGSDPFIVLDDADVEKAGRVAVTARMINSGQSCIAAKRFIVMEEIAEEFKKVFLGRLKELKIGDPMDETTDVGPVAKREILDTLNEQRENAKAKGAEILQAGHSFSKGLFFSPCVISNPNPQMRIMTEEVFGPIAPVIVVRDEDEAVRIANDTPFGLGASVWSRDLKRAERIAERIDAGCIAINDMVKSDPRLPFGGVKKSGVGRELSHYGLKEFVNIKTVVVRE
ncbi:MAG: NAD-dependent succinate-semialdehyde dehydrogenase [Nitrospiraceae bacterium]|nr:NAD-dependent succinate-semialdehyde dehydrogenase [Nitrospiraceae bacterium]